MWWIPKSFNVQTAISNSIFLLLAGTFTVKAQAIKAKDSISIDTVEGRGFFIEKKAFGEDSILWRTDCYFSQQLPVNIFHLFDSTHVEGLIPLSHDEYIRRGVQKYGLEGLDNYFFPNNETGFRLYAFQNGISIKAFPVRIKYYVKTMTLEEYIDSVESLSHKYSFYWIEGKTKSFDVIIPVEIELLK